MILPSLSRCSKPVCISFLYLLNCVFFLTVSFFVYTLNLIGVQNNTRPHWWTKTVEKFRIHSLKSYRFGKRLRRINRLKNSFYPRVIRELIIVGIHKYIKLRNAQIWWGNVLLLCISLHFILFKFFLISLHFFIVCNIMSILRHSCAIFVHSL